VVGDERRVAGGGWRVAGGGWRVVILLSLAIRNCGRSDMSDGNLAPSPTDVVVVVESENVRGNNDGISGGGSSGGGGGGDARTCHTADRPPLFRANLANAHRPDSRGRLEALVGTVSVVDSHLHFPSRTR